MSRGRFCKNRKVRLKRQRLQCCLVHLDGAEGSASRTHLGLQPTSLVNRLQVPCNKLWYGREEAEKFVSPLFCFCFCLQNTPTTSKPAVHLCCSISLTGRQGSGGGVVRAGQGETFQAENKVKRPVTARPSLNPLIKVVMVCGCQRILPPWKARPLPVRREDIVRSGESFSFGV